MMMMICEMTERDSRKGVCVAEKDFVVCYSFAEKMNFRNYSMEEQ